MKRLMLVGLGVVGLATAAVLGRTGVEAGGGGGCREPMTDGAATQIEIVDFCYGPTVARVDAGSAVTWVNRDATPHNIYASGQGWSDGKSFSQGATVSALFERSGVFPYVCTFHPGMVGVIVVGDGTSTAAAYQPAAPAAVLASRGTELAANDSSPSSPAVAAATNEGDRGRTVALAGLAVIGSAVTLGFVGLVTARRR